MRVKRRIFCGAVCMQEVYSCSDRADLKKVEHRPRFKNEEEREKHKLGISRRRHAQLFNANFSPASLYSTLTCDRENECHDFEDIKRLRDLYFRRLKYAYPDAVIFIYVGRGKTTHRYHIHMVTNGIPEEAIISKWGFGCISRVEHLRTHNYYNGVDCGQDYTGLANYLFDHWCPDFGPRRWKQTKNAKQPERETATEAKREYTEEHPPKAPKGYTLTEVSSNKYGYYLFKYVKIPPPDPHGHRQRLSAAVL